MSEIMTLPDGTCTKSRRRYLRDWMAFKKPIENALDMQIIGFDPGLLMCAKGKGGSIDMPIWFARRLSEALKVVGPNV